VGLGCQVKVELVCGVFRECDGIAQNFDYRKHAASVLKEVITSPLSPSLTTLTALFKRFGWVSWLVYPFFEIVSFLPLF
jgi:hypothetical protein